MSSSPVYFRQLLSGRDFARSNGLAAQMANNVYLIGDTETKECLVVDPAYATQEILDVAAADGMNIQGVLVSHYHADHIGGSMMGHTIAGIAELLGQRDVPVHVNEHEIPWVTRTTGVAESQLVAHRGGDQIEVGCLTVDLVHTPGHTPGSQCFHVHGALISGDTLFLD